MIITPSELGGGVRLLMWDDPDRPVNVKSAPAVAAFIEAARAAIADKGVGAVILASGKRDFVVGGDLEELVATHTPEAAARLTEPIQQLFREMETGGTLFVAALGGSALGGGLELAMACHRRIAADIPGLRLGQPEVGLGLIPGAGGTQRLPRLIGIEAAARMLLGGKPVGAEEALRLGLVDELCPPDELIDRARAWIESGPEPVQPWDRRGFRLPGFQPQEPAGRAFFSGQWPRLHATPAGLEAAPNAILHLLHHGCERTIDPALRLERQHFAALVPSREVKGRIRTLFFGVNAARGLKDRPEGQPDRTPARVAVLGGGLMGAGIAFALARAGARVDLLETGPEAAAAARTRVGALAERAVSSGRMGAESAGALMARITAHHEAAQLAGADMAIEAVVEREAVKVPLLAEVATVLGPDATIASNTSTIPIGRLADACAAPDAVLGMHFFAPAERMPLLEIITTDRTRPAALAAALDCARLLGKTPIVVRDGLGFFTSRVVAAYTAEALTLLAEGVAPQRIDNAARAAGMPLGPLAMADLTGLDTLCDIFASLGSAGPRPADAGARAVEVLERLARDAGRTGRRAGAGIYDHEGRETSLWPGLADLFPTCPTPPPQETIIDRLLLAQAIEAARALEEGIIGAAVDADVASVTGWGFPARLGGVLGQIDMMGGDAARDRIAALAAECGARFAPPPGMDARLRRGRGFFD
ncbi:MAG: enoyl-CoA hydratase/isomerase family protein [Rhodobacteraceae bacterium]|nr:enoyl-CoA hydratase/isomerase family protein [Paracoccaceae bacterium]